MGENKRLLLVVVLLAAGIAGCSEAPSRERTPDDAGTGRPTVENTPTLLPRASARTGLLLPNLHSLPAEDVQIRITDDGTRELRFAAALANIGPGPLVVAPDDNPLCQAEQRHASQEIVIDANDDGRYDSTVDAATKTNPAGCMLDHPTHDHWHFDASASYVLTRPGESTPIVQAPKVSFCLRDSRPLPAPNAPTTAETFGDCDRESRQGITVGFADVYDVETPGQFLPLSDDLPDGLYCLTLTADPQQLLREVADDDNASTIGVQITGEDATTVSPSACPAPP